MNSIEDVQASYIQEMRTLLPGILAWWNDLLARDGDRVVWRRWPTGFSGHPRVIATFRKYFFEVERHNEGAAAAFTREREVSREEMWGKDDVGKAAPVRRPAEWLISDIEDAAPDIYDLVRGLCLVPIGMDEDEETV